MSGTLKISAPGAVEAGRSFDASVAVSGAPGLARVRVTLTRHGNGSLEELKVGDPVVTTTATGEATVTYTVDGAERPGLTLVATASCLDPPFEGFYFEPATKLVAVV